MKPSTDPRTRSLTRIRLVFDQKTMKARVELFDADRSLLISSGALADAIAAGRPLLPMLLRASNHPEWAHQAEHGSFSGRQTLESMSMRRSSLRIEHDEDWVFPGASGYRICVKVPGLGEPAGFNLDPRIVEQAARSGKTMLRAAIEATPPAMERARISFSHLVTALDADAVADASQRDDLRSGKKPTI